MFIKAKACYLNGILFVILISLILSLPAGYENDSFAKGAFLTAFICSIGWSFIFLWISVYNSSLRTFFFFILFSLFVLETVVYVSFGSRIDPNIMTLVMQTDLQESMEFLDSFLFTWKSLLCALIIVFLMILILKRFFAIDLTGLKDIMGFRIFSLITIIVSLSFPYFTSIHIGDNTIKGIYHAISFVRDSHSDINHFISMIDKVQVYPDLCDQDPPIIVFVIGESFNKNHSQLYGYKLPTAPKLSKEKNLVVFKKAQTPNCYTYGAMRYIFSLKSCCGQSDDSLKYILFPSVFKKASFRVAYFDNQYTRSRGGVTDYGCNYFFSPKYISEHCFSVRNDFLEKYDGVFIDKNKPLLEKGERALNIIHLKGQHIEASKRYPPNFNYFQEKDILRPDLTVKEKRRVAAYDNATRYNDFVIDKIIDEFRKEDAILVYLSDHGDNIYDGIGHRYGRNISELKDRESLINVRQIPFVIWCSDLYVQKRPEKFHDIKKASSLHLCSDDVAYLLFDLAGIQFNFGNSTKSVINTSYHPHKTAIEI